MTRLRFFVNVFFIYLYICPLLILLSLSLVYVSYFKSDLLLLAPTTCRRPRCPFLPPPPTLSLTALCHWQDLPRSPVAPPLDSCFLRPARPANRRPPSRWAAHSPSSSPKWSEGSRRRFTFPPPGHRRTILEGEEPAWGRPLPPLTLLHLSLKDPVPQNPLLPKSRDSQETEPEGGGGVCDTPSSTSWPLWNQNLSLEEPGMYCNIIKNA